MGPMEAGMAESEMKLTCSQPKLETPVNGAAGAGGLTGTSAAGLGDTPAVEI